MTPFMLRVAELLESDPDVPVPAPSTVPSRITRVNAGTDRQVALRALAEQLMCEANAVLGADGDQMSLRDELFDGRLGFAVAYRGRTARVVTRIQDHTAYACLTGDGIADDAQRELAGPDALPDLLLRLLAESGVPRRT
jgi:hypothetical protein